jgi:hypothetical protein
MFTIAWLGSYDRQPDRAPQTKSRGPQVGGGARRTTCIEVGCFFFRWAFKLAVRSPEARKATEALALLQLGMAKRGAEAYVHSLRALWTNGFALLNTDFPNGFNEILRQAILGAVQGRCAQFMSLFNLFYKCDGACFFSVGNSTEIIWGKEGVRMGCPLGSFVFDLALQAVLEQAARRNNLHIVRAITDDSVLAVRLPTDPPAAAAALRVRTNFDGMRT